MKTAYFVSDLHLVSPDDNKGDLFLRFLKWTTRNAKENEGTQYQLFLVGDVFDLWIADHKYFLEKFKSVITEIQNFAKGGGEVFYFEGNHDLYLENFWKTKLGCKVFKAPEVFEINGRRIRVEHGDLMNPQDKGYRFLKWFLHTPPISALAHSLPGPVINSIGSYSSQVSKNFADKNSAEFEKDVKAWMREYGERELVVSNSDILITGHTHVCDEFDFVKNGSTKKFVNLGSWYEPPRVYTVTSDFVGFRNVEELVSTQ